MAGDAILFTGPGGCGKSHRLRTLDEEHDGPVLVVRGSVLERETWFGPLRSLAGGEIDHHAMAASIIDELGDDGLLLVDDAHLMDEASLAAIAAVVGRVGRVAVAHRPTDRPEVAALDASVGAQGDIEVVAPLDEDALGSLLAVATGSAVDGDILHAIHGASGGVPGWALPLSSSATHDDPLAGVVDALGELVGAELLVAGEVAGKAARAKALAGALPDAVLAAAVDAEPSELRDALDRLAVGSLLDPRDGSLWPAVSAAIRVTLSGARRRELHERLAAAVIDRGGELRDAAEHLLAAGATGDAAAEVFARAADEIRFRDPETALEWYDDASAAGTVPAGAVVGAMEARLHAGRPTIATAVPRGLAPTDRMRVMVVRAVDEARGGHSGRAAGLLDAVAADATGHPALSAEAASWWADVLHTASAPVGDPAPRATPDPLDGVAELAHRLATACRAQGTDPLGSPARFVDAATAHEQLDADVVVPDSAHAIGALHLAALGDFSGATILVERARHGDVGGPLLQTRHRLLEAWLHLRAGRYELPVAVVRENPDTHDARDTLIRASIVAGIARRNGDIARLRDAWSGAEPLLLAGTGDLHHLEVVGELLVAAARLGHRERAQPLHDRLAALVVGPAGAWAVPLHWLDVQLAVECEDVAGAESAFSRLAEATRDTPHDRALGAAAAIWIEIIADRVAGDDWPVRVEEAAEGLAARGIPWDASRLAGQAAIRLTEAAAARGMLELARRLHRATDTIEPTAASDAGLSERELEIARGVVDGLTHKEIGAQLYISPKTVEHHVARIRRKVQAGSRAEMLAILRDLVPSRADDSGR